MNTLITISKETGSTISEQKSLPNIHFSCLAQNNCRYCNTFMKLNKSRNSIQKSGGIVRTLQLSKIACLQRKYPIITAMKNTIRQGIAPILINVLFHAVSGIIRRLYSVPECDVEHLQLKMTLKKFHLKSITFHSFVDLAFFFCEH